MAVLGEAAVLWRDVGRRLRVPDTAMNVIALESTSSLQRLRGTVIYWLIHDPLASWRRLVHRFDWSSDHYQIGLANDCRSFTEKISGQCNLWEGGGGGVGDFFG